MHVGEREHRLSFGLMFCNTRALMNATRNEPRWENTMKNGTNETANGAYRKALREAKRDLGLLEIALANHRLRQKTDAANWGHVGDLNHVRELLAEIRTFLGVGTDDELHCDHADSLCREAVGLPCDDPGQRGEAMRETGFSECLKAILADGMDVNESFDPDGIRHVETFKDAEIMTTNAGLVVRMDDGTEFQLTIVRSRLGRRDNEEDE